MVRRKEIVEVLAKFDDLEIAKVYHKLGERNITEIDEIKKDDIEKDYDIENAITEEDVMVMLRNLNASMQTIQMLN